MNANGYSKNRPSPRLNCVISGTCLRVGALAALGSGTGIQVTSAVRVHDRDLEQAAREVRVVVRREAVEAAVALVLGLVDALADRIDAGRLVRERPSAGRHDGRLLAEDVAFPREALAVLLAREPRVPRRLAAGAVGLGPVEDAVGVRSACGVLVEPDRERAALTGQRRLGVHHQDPAAVLLRVRRRSVGEDGHREGGPRHREVASPDQPRLEAVGKAEAVGVRRPEVAVRAGAGPRLARERAAQERGVEAERSSGYGACLDEAPCGSASRDQTAAREAEVVKNSLAQVHGGRGAHREQHAEVADVAVDQQQRAPRSGTGRP